VHLALAVDHGGLRYISKEGGSPFAASVTGSRMSCYKCGLHKALSLSSFGRLFNQIMFVRADCWPSWNSLLS